MQQSFAIDVVEKTPNQKFQNLRITSRDIDMLRFICEMKFAGVAEVHNRFFEKLHCGSENSAIRWAQQRLSQLEKGGFLLRSRMNGHPRSLFTTTYRGWKIVSAKYPSEVIPYPSRGVDIRTYFHDKFILESRIQMENQGEVQVWISEKVLQKTGKQHFGIQQKFIPDAVYQTKSGEWIAFEVEIATKARDRYREKIKYYVQFIRSRAGDPQMFKKVRFLCLRKSVFEILKNETSLYGPLFEVELCLTSNSGEVRAS